MVIAQLPEVRQIVPRPGGGDPLRPRDGTAGDVEGREAVAHHLQTGLPTGAGHEIGEERTDAPRGKLPPEETGQHVPIRHVVLVVVIPDVWIALLRQLLPHAGLPEGVGTRIGEIQVAGHAAPEGEASGTPVCVVQEVALLRERFIQGMLGEKRGLYIGKQSHAVLPEILRQPLRRGDLVPVPVEDAAALSNLGIAAGEIEAAGTDAVLPALFHKAPQLPVGVGGVGILHGAAAVAKSPVGQRGQLAAEGGKAPQDLRRASQEEVEHQILLLQTDGVEGLKIVVVLLAEVYAAVGVAVVIETVGAGAVFADVKGDLLIERVAILGTKAHGIRGGKRKAAPGLVHSSAFVSQPEDPLSRLPAGVVERSVPQLSGKVIGETRAVGVQNACFVSRRDAEVLLLHGELYPGEREAEFLLVLLNFRRGQGKALGGELVPSLQGTVARERPDAPGGHEGNILPQQRHPQYVLAKIQPHPHPVRLIETHGGRSLPQRKAVLVFHAFGSPFVSMLNASFR